MTKLCLTLCAPLALVMVVLAVWPKIDLDAARMFYVGPARFIGNTPALVVVRYTAWTIPFVTYFALFAAWLFARGSRWAPSGRGLMFLTLTLAIGPGLLVHAGLKEISHRPRPYSVAEFGGPDRFRPYTRFDGVCPHNCSFPSGETSAATWMLAPAALVPAPWRGMALGVAVIFAAGTGGLRMALGGHFLSDVCGAALITILVILSVWLWLFRARRTEQNTTHAEK